jgi:hypothetical protein
MFPWRKRRAAQLRATHRRENECTMLGVFEVKKEIPA